MHELAPQQAKEPKAAGPKAPAPPPIGVWLVEDNHTFRHTVAKVLNQVPALECARHFANSEDALAALVEGAVADVILLDVELPGLNGIEAVKRIKALSPATRVIMHAVLDAH